MFKTNKKGSALALTVVFATILLQLALVYSYQVRNTTKSTTQIDGRVRLQYLSDGMAQMALLKFQKFPSDFYNAWEYREVHEGPLKVYSTEAPEFRSGEFDNEDDQPVSIISRDKRILVSLTRMDLHSSQKKWDEEILTITTGATQRTLSDQDLVTNTTITVKTTRTVVK